MYQFPFTLLSGKGLGASYSSLSRNHLHNNGEVLPSRSIGQAGVQLYFNAGTGNLIVRDHVCIAKEPGNTIALNYYYNSQSKPTSWRLGISSMLPPANKQILLTEADGYVASYTYDDISQCYVAPLCDNGRPYIKADGDKWLWCDPESGRSKIYNKEGLLEKISDERGRSATYYYENKELVKIESSSGNYYEITRQNNEVQFYMVEPSQNNEKGKEAKKTKSVKEDKITHLQTCIFASGLLQKTIVGDKQNYTINYGYNDKGQINSITQTDNMAVKFEYDYSKPDCRLSKVLLNNNKEVHYITYPENNKVEISYNSYQKINVTVDSENRLTEVCRSSGIQVHKLPDYKTSFTYSKEGQLATVTKPNSAVYKYSYNSDSGLLVLAEMPDGGSTAYIYDHESKALVAHVEFLNEDLSKKSSKKTNDVGRFLATRYIYEPQKNSNNRLLRFAISPTGRVTEYRYDNKNNIDSKRIYNKKNFDLSKFKPSEQPVFSDVVDWVNKYDISDPHSVSLTEYNYDDRGQDRAIRQYAKCDKSQDISNGKSYYFNNYFGGCERKIETQINNDIVNNAKDKNDKKSRNDEPKPDKVVQYSNRFDDLYRTTSSVLGVQDESVKQTTSFAYNELQDKTVHVKVYPNGLVESKTLDNSGFVSQEIQVVSNNSETKQRITEYSRDNFGRLILTKTPDGKRHFSFYDLQDRLIYEVSPEGQVTEHSYIYIDHAAQMYTATIKYANKIDINKLQPFPDMLPDLGDLYYMIKKDPANDCATYNFYDENSRLRFSVNGNQFITEKRYDTLGRVTCQIAYKTQLTDDDLSNLKAGKLQLTPDPNKGDQIWNTYYDDNNQVLAEIDPGGFVTENKRDSAGNIIEEIVYENKVAKLGIQVRQFDKVRPTVNPKDAHGYSFYDGRNRLILHVDAEGFISSHTYYANNKPKCDITYATKVDSVWYKDTSKMPEIKTDKNDYAIEYQYDGIDRISSTKYSDAKNVNIKYDEMDHRVLTESVETGSETSDDADKRRRTLKRFDKWDQCIAIAPAMVAQRLAEIDNDESIKDKEAAKEKVWQEHSHRFAYDDTGLMVKSTNTLGKETLYVYNESRKPVLIIKPTGAVTEYIYNAFNQKISTRQYINRLTTEQLDIIKKQTSGFITTQIKGFLQPDKERDVINTCDYDRRGNVIKSVDPEGFVTTTTFNNMNKIEIEIHPITKDKSLTIKREYEPRGMEAKVTQTSDDLQVITEKEYNNPYGKITKYTDENGNFKLFEYDKVGNHSKTKDAKDNILEEYQYDALSKITNTKDALGNVTKYEHDYKNRTLTTIMAEKDTKVTIEKNIFSENIKITNALNQYKKYQHAPNGKVSKTIEQITSDPDQDSISEKAYNYEGQITSEKDALNSINTTSYDDNGNINEHVVDKEKNKAKVKDDNKDELNLVTTIQNDTFGNSEFITNPRGTIEQRVRDRRGLVVQSIRDIGTKDKTGLYLTTDTEYNAQHSRTSVTQSDAKNSVVYKVNFNQDSLGRTTKKIVDPGETENSLNLTQSNVLDNKGKVILHCDPRGNKDYLFYDEYDNKRFEVKADGSVLEWQYDLVKNPTSRCEYKQKVDINKISETMSLVELQQEITSDNEDFIHAYFYDANNQERFVVSYFYDFKTQTTQGVLTEKRYDKAGRVISRVGYADYLSSDLMKTLTYASLVKFAESNTNPDNRIDYSVYNARGEERFHIDPMGVVTERCFDAKGRIYQQIYYAVQLSKDQSKEIAQKKPEEIIIEKNKEQDRITYTVFDAVDKPIYAVDAELGVVYFGHDKNSNLIQECHFKDPLKQPENYDDLVQKCLALEPDATKDSIIEHTRDAVDRISATKDPRGYDDVYTRDAVDNVVEHKDRAGNVWQLRYDGAKRLTLKISPEVEVTTVSKDKESNKLTQKTEIRSVQECMLYDESNNVTKVIKDYTGDEREMRFEYSSTNKRTKTIIPNVQIDDSQKSADFTNLPTTTVNLTMENVYDGKHEKVVEIQKNGSYKFNVFDSLDRKAYELIPVGTDKNSFAVIGYDRNAFGNIIRKIKYYDAIKIDAEKHASTGVSLAEVYDKVKSLEGNSQNRETLYEVDAHGDTLKIIEGKKIYYFPGSDKPKMGNLEINYKYDVFRNRILIEKTRFPEYPDLNDKKIQWYDKQNQQIAEAETIQEKLEKDSLLETPIKYRVNRKYRDTRSKEIEMKEYANSISQQLTSKTTLKELDEMCEKGMSPKSRITKKEYDLSGNLIKTTKVGVVTQVANIKKLANNFKDDDAICPQVKDQIKKLQENGKNLKFANKSNELKQNQKVFTREVEHNIGTNIMLYEFIGSGEIKSNQTRFKTHYTLNICKYLINLGANQASCLPYVFDEIKDQNDFTKKFTALKKLSDHLKKPAVFILQIPGEANYIMGCYYKSKLICLDPLGKELNKQNTAYNLLSDLQRSTGIDVLVSKAKLQRDPQHQQFSSGVIAVELVLHCMKIFVQQSPDEFFSALKIENKKSTNELKYSELNALSIIKLLPKSIMDILTDDLRVYAQNVLSLRALHYKLLKVLPTECAQQSKLRISDVRGVCLNSPVEQAINLLLANNNDIKIANVEQFLKIFASKNYLMSGLEKISQHQAKTAITAPKIASLEDLPSMHDTEPQDLTIEKKYTPTGKVYASKNEEDSWKYQTIDARGFCVAHTDTPFKGKDGKDIIPLSYTGINAHGQQVMKTRYVNGAKEIKTDGKTKPIPDKLDANSDQVHLNYFDNRGLMTYKQDPRGYQKVSTHTSSRKTARKFWYLTSLKKINSREIKDEKSIIEQRFVFDFGKRPTVMAWYKNDQKENETFYQYNNFGEDFAQGSNQQTPEIYDCFDTAGNVFSTNHNHGNTNGKSVVILSDLMGAKTAVIQSAKIDLSKVKTQQDVIALFDDSANNVDDLQIILYLPDPCGRNLRVVDLPFNAHKAVCNFNKHDFNKNADEIPKIKLCMQVSKSYPKIGALSIAWLKLNDTTLKPKFYLWQRDEQESTTSLNCAEQDGMIGVDVSKNITDRYKYRLVFVFTNPVTHEEEIHYQTTGELQFDTGIYTSEKNNGQKNQQTSKGVVTELKENNILWICGNVTDVDAVELWDGDTKINTFKVTATSNPYQKTVDLNHKDLTSSIYQIKCVRGEKTDELASFNFSLYTNKPSVLPLSREIDCQAQILTQDNYGELSIWESLPWDYKNTPVRLSCDYNYYFDESLKGGELTLHSVTTYDEYKKFVDKWQTEHEKTLDILLIYVLRQKSWNVCGLNADKKMVCQNIYSDSELGKFLKNLDISSVSAAEKAQSFRLSCYFLKRSEQVNETFEIKPKQSFAHYCDKNADEIIPNIKFAHNLNEIISVTLSLIIDTKNAIMLYKQSMPVSNQNNELLEVGDQKRASLFALQTIKAKNRVLLGMAQTRKLAKIHNKASEIITWHFAPQNILYITPFTLNLKNDLPDLHFLNITQGLEAEWTTAQIMSSNDYGVIINASGFVPAEYSYWIGKDEKPYKVFYVFKNSQVYASDDAKNQPTVITTNKDDKFLDRWDNELETIKTNGDETLVTKNEFNHNNNKTKITYPSATVVDTSGTVYDGMITEIKIGWNKAGYKIGETNENGYTRIYILNPNGKQIAQILEEGTLAWQNLVNGLGQSTAYLDGRGKATQMEYNQTDKTVKIVKPNGESPLIEEYTHDEEDNRISEKDTAGNITKYGFDGRKNLIFRVDPIGILGYPLITQYICHYPSGQVIQQINPDEKSLRYTVDYFGNETGRILLDGTQINLILDFNKRVISRTSVLGSSRQYLQIVKCVYHNPRKYWEEVTYYDLQLTSVQPQNIKYQYTNDLLVKIIDVTHNKQLEYGYDTLKRRISAILKFENDQLERVMKARYDGKGNITFVNDNNATIMILPDKAENRVYVKAVFTFNGGTAINEFWNLMGLANETLIDHGALINKSIQAVEGSLTISYENSLRAKEIKKEYDETITTDLIYDDAERLKETVGVYSKIPDQKVTTARTYNDGEDLIAMEEKTEAHSKKETYSFDANHWLLSQSSYEDGNWKQTLTEKSYTVNGNVLSEHIALSDYGAWIDRTYRYDSLDTEKLTEVDATSYNDQGGFLTMYPATRYWDANMTPNGELNCDDTAEGSQYGYKIYFSTTPDGLILRKRHINTHYDTSGGIGKEVEKQKIDDELVFVDPNGTPYAGYSMSATDISDCSVKLFDVHQGRNKAKNNAKTKRLLTDEDIRNYSYTGYANHVSYNGGSWGALNGNHMSDVYGAGNNKHLVVYDQVKSYVDYGKPFIPSEFIKKLHPTFRPSIPTPSSSYPNITPRIYEVPSDSKGMSLAEIAVVNGMDPWIAVPAISLENGITISQVCQPGMKVKLPRLQMNINTEMEELDFGKLMAAVLGSLSPHLDFKQPKQHNSCIQIIIKVLVPLISVILAAWLGPAIFGQIGWLETMLVDGLLGGAIDAWSQNALVSLGVLDHFSWTEVLETAVAAATAGYMKQAKFLENFKATHDIATKMNILMQAVAIQGAANAATQLAEIKLKLKSKFDVKMLIATMLSAAVDLGLGSQMKPLKDDDFFGKLVESKAMDFVNDVIGGAIMGTPDLQTFAAQELGSTMGEYGGEFLPDNQKGGEHQASKELYKNGTKQSKSYIEAHANAKGAGGRTNYIPNTPDIKDETDNTKYEASVHHSTNKPVTSTNRGMVKGMDDTGRNSYLEQSVKAQLDKVVFGGVNNSNIYKNDFVTYEKFSWSGTKAQTRAFFGEFGQIAISTGMFLDNLVFNPIDTVKNIVHGVETIVEHPLKFAKGVETVYDRDQEVLHAGGIQADKLRGKLYMDVLSLCFGGGEIGDVAKGLNLVEKTAIVAGKGVDAVKSIPKLAKNSAGFWGKGAKNAVSLYRAVSVDEYKQLLSTKNFAIGPNSLEGKFFAENFDDAQKWGEVLNGPNMSKVIEVKIPKNITDQMTKWKKLDGIGPAYYGTLDLLKNVKVELPDLVDENLWKPNIR